MRYIYKCIRCEKDIEEIQGNFDKTLPLEGAMCRDCCRESVSFNTDGYSKIERMVEMGEGKGHKRLPCKWCGKDQAARWLKHHEQRCEKNPHPKAGEKSKSAGGKRGAIKRKTSTNNTVPPEVYLEIQAAYATGKFEEFLRGHAESSGVPFPALTRRVAESLHALASR